MVANYEIIVITCVLVVIFMLGVLIINNHRRS